MPVPKKRNSRSRQGKRRSHDHLKAINVISCTQCGGPVKYHHVCPRCNYYKGKAVTSQ